MPGPYRFEVQGLWQMEAGTWVQRSTGYLVDTPTLYGYNNWQEIYEVWRQAGGGPGNSDWVKLGKTDKYVTVYNYTPENVLSIRKTGSHNNYESRVTWTNPVGSTAFNILATVTNFNDPSWSFTASGVNPGDTSVPFQQTGSAAGQEVEWAVTYQDEDFLTGPAAYGGVVVLQFAP